LRQRHDVTAPTTGISELKIATLPTGLQLSNWPMHKCHKVRHHLANKEKPIYLCDWVWLFITFAKKIKP